MAKQAQSQGPLRLPLALDTTPAAEERQIAGFQGRSPEDVVLNKLAWYELGNRVSDQQWRDIQSILRVQGDTLDQDYLQRS